MNLSELAKLNGTNIKRLAEKCGIPATTLYAISNGSTNVDNVGIDVFLKIARGLDMSAEGLMNEIGHSEIKYAVVSLDALADAPSSDERELVDLYRAMGERERVLLMENARAFAALSVKDGAGNHEDVERAGIAVS